LLSHFPDPQVRNSVALDLAMMEQYDELLPKLERHIRVCAKQHDRKAFTLLRSLHGADLILPLVIGSLNVGDEPPPTSAARRVPNSGRTPAVWRSARSRSHAAASLGSSQPGNTRTPG
jgi:hypothetical protein